MWTEKKNLISDDDDFATYPKSNCGVGTNILKICTSN